MRVGNRDMWIEPGGKNSNILAVSETPFMYFVAWKSKSFMQLSLLLKIHTGVCRIDRCIWEKRSYLHWAHILQDISLHYRVKRYDQKPMRFRPPSKMIFFAVFRGVKLVYKVLLSSGIPLALVIEILGIDRGGNI